MFHLIKYTGNEEQEQAEWIMESCSAGHVSWTDSEYQPLRFLKGGTVPEEHRPVIVGAAPPAGRSTYIHFTCGPLHLPPLHLRAAPPAFASPATAPPATAPPAGRIMPAFRQVGEKQLPNPVLCMAWSPKRDLIALANTAGEVSFSSWKPSNSLCWFFIQSWMFWFS